MEDHFNHEFIKLIQQCVLGASAAFHSPHGLTSQFSLRVHLRDNSITALAVALLNDEIKTIFTTVLVIKSENSKSL